MTQTKPSKVNNIPNEGDPVFVFNTSNDAFRMIFDQSNTSMFIADPDTLHLVYANNAASKLYGYSVDDLLTMKITDLDATPEPEIRKELGRILRIETGRCSVIHHKADNAMLALDMQCSPITIEGKQYIFSIQRDSSTFNEMEHALRKSEERNRRIVETATEGIWAIDHEKTTTFVNNRMCNMLGYSPDEMIGHSIEEFISMEDGEHQRTQLDLLLSGNDLRFEARFQHKDGTMIWMDGSAMAVRDPAGVVTGGFAMFTDTTEQKHALEKLKTNEALLLNTLNNAPVVVFELDADGMFVVSEGKGLQKLGFVPGQVVGKSALDLYKAYPDLIADIHRALKGDAFSSVADLGFVKYEIWYNPIKNAQGKINGTIGIAVDITEMMDMQDAWKESENKFLDLFNTSHDGIATSTIDGMITECNQAFVDMLSYKSPADLIGKKFDDLTPPEFLHIERSEINERLLETGYTGEYEKEYIRSDGSRVPVQIKRWLRKDKYSQPVGAWAVIQDVTSAREAKRALEASEYRFKNLAMNLPVGIYENDANRNNIYVNRRWRELTGIESKLVTPQDWMNGIYPDDMDRVNHEWQKLFAESEVFYEEYRRILPDGKVVWIADRERSIVNDKGSVLGYLGTLTDITQMKNAEKEIEHSLSLLQATLDSSNAGIVAIDLDHRVTIYNKLFADIWRLDYQSIERIQEKDLLQRIAGTIRDPEQFLNHVSDVYKKSEGTNPEILRLRDGRIIEYYSMPQRMENKVVGRVWSFSDVTDRIISEEKLRQNFEEMELMVQQLTALRNIDIAITGHTSFFDVVKEIMPNVVKSLNIDAAALLLPHPDGKNLSLIASEGLSSQNPEDETLYQKLVPISTRYAGLAYRDRRTVMQPVIDVSNPVEQPDARFKEKFSSYIAAPLVAKDSVKGVLEVFTRKPISVNKSWKEYLHSLTLQIAIAIENADLFNQMQRTNLDLLAAYEATIEGWARALELRDKETLGHSERVIDLTLRLAREMGIPQDQWTQIRRGVFLHDIGKMGIPDNILLKPGPLTDDEWIIMKQHPTFAYEMLSNVPYLRPALDIPYCHHERWDGSGYPQGLDGDTIPLAARIFSVVDVWDALTSRRPYRPAWPVSQVKSYMRENSGKQFDPSVVDVFLKIIEAEG